MHTVFESGSFVMRNVNALKRSSPDCALLTTLCSQPCVGGVSTNASVMCRPTHRWDRILYLYPHTRVADKREAPVRSVLPYKDQKSANVEYVNSWLTSVRRLTQILAQFTQVERSRMKLRSGKTSSLL